MSDKPEALHGLLDETEKLLHLIKSTIRWYKEQDRDHETAWLEQAEDYLINAYLSMDVASMAVKGRDCPPPGTRCRHCDFTDPSPKKVQYHEAHMCWKNPNREV